MFLFLRFRGAALRRPWDSPGHVSLGPRPLQGHFPPKQKKYVKNLAGSVLRHEIIVIIISNNYVIMGDEAGKILPPSMSDDYYRPKRWS